MYDRTVLGHIRESGLCVPTRSAYSAEAGRSPVPAEVSHAQSETLVKTGDGGKTVECGLCHGTDLTGLGPVPGIAGRSPGYLVRQMYDMPAGARQGEWGELMKPVVVKLGDEDFVNIAAYVSSLMPPNP